MRDIVDIISELKYEINNTLKLQDKNLMFQPSYEDAKRVKILGTPCTIESDMMAFSTTLYKVVYEETKVGKLCKATLGKYNNHPFTFYVSELRHYYDHGFAEYVSTKKVKVSDVFKKYLKKAIAPKTAEEFQIIQRGLLNDFIDFLNTINEAFPSSDNKVKIKPVKGEIEEDDKGLLHCHGILLNPRYKDYIGCECGINSAIKNNNPLTNKVYPYYTAFVATIGVNISGLIAVDTEKCHCKDILLPDAIRKNVGSKIVITAIKPIPKPNSAYKMMAVKYKVITGKKQSEKAVKSETVIEPTVPLGERVEVELDTDNLTHAGNVYIGSKKKCYKGDFVRILAVEKNPTPEIAVKYPLVATKLEKVVDNNGIAKIYTVEEDENGKLHADNIMLLPKAKCIKGDRIMILQISQNKDQHSKPAYPLVAHKVVILNKNIPDVEEKTTKIVSKYEKYVKNGLGILGAAILAIIIIILSKFNLIVKD